MTRAKRDAPEGAYVYALIDPRDDSTFYIGKGRGLRAWIHEKNERRSQERNALKAEKLGQIRRAGLRPIVEIIEAGLTDAAAYRLERSLIVKNHAALTNISLGQRSMIESLAAQLREDLASLVSFATILRRKDWRTNLPLWCKTRASLRRLQAKAEAMI